MNTNECSRDQCQKPVERAGRCFAHYMQDRRKEGKGPCSVDQCTRSASTAGMCDMHYQRVLKTGEPGEADARWRLTDPGSPTKVCTMCKVEKPKEAFFVQSRSRDGRQSWCAACTRIANFANKYEMDFGTVQEFVQQHDHCLICDSEDDLVIDHCHDTNALRGVLCRKCNTGIGMFSHDPRLLRKAADWLGLTMGIDVTATAS